MNVGDSCEDFDHNRRRFPGTAAMTVPHLQPSVSDAALMTATDGTNGEVELPARGGLGPARLRRIKELVHGKMEDELSLDEMAQSVGLSTAHFARMFRKSTGETPHQFILRQRIERAKAMLRDDAMRILDVAVACGFKTQQHFAQVFRDFCGVRPTAYRQDFVDSEVACAPKTCSKDSPRSEILGSCGPISNSRSMSILATST